MLLLLSTGSCGANELRAVDLALHSQDSSLYVCIGLRIVDKHLNCYICVYMGYTFPIQALNQYIWVLYICFQPFFICFHTLFILHISFWHVF